MPRNIQTGSIKRKSNIAESMNSSDETESTSFQSASSRTNQIYNQRSSSRFNNAPTRRSPEKRLEIDRTSQRKRSRKQTKPMHYSVPNAIKEIKRLQMSTNRLIPLAPFMRLVREIVHKYKPNCRMTPSSIECLQEASEIYLIQLLEDSYRCTLHRQRVTLGPTDIQLVRHLRGLKDPGN